jgi:hypothetical protein
MRLDFLFPVFVAVFSGDPSWRASDIDRDKLNRSHSQKRSDFVFAESANATCCRETVGPPQLLQW